MLDLQHRNKHQDWDQNMQGRHFYTHPEKKSLNWHQTDANIDFCHTDSQLSDLRVCVHNIMQADWTHWLTHWGRDKMAAIFQMTFSNAFSWMKMYEFRSRFHWSLFLRVQWTIFQLGSENGLAPTRQQAIIWNNDGHFTDTYMSHSASVS